MYVYQITNLVNNKIYIGITNDYKKRWANECSKFSDPTKMQVINHAIQKYGKNNFKFEILYSGLSIEEACEKEISLIKDKNCLVPSGYNVAKDGLAPLLGVSKYGEDNNNACLTNEEAQYIKDHRDIPMYVLYDEFSDRIGYEAFRNCYNHVTYTNLSPKVECYPYNFEFSCQFTTSKLDYGDIVYLREQYKKGVYWKEVYQNYKDLYPNWQTFWNIYVGNKFQLVMPEIFTPELKKLHSSLGKQGSNNSHAKLTVEDVKRIRQLHDEGLTNTEIHKDYPQVTATAIRNVVNRVTWKNV